MYLYIYIYTTNQKETTTELPLHRLYVIQTWSTYFHPVKNCGINSASAIVRWNFLRPRPRASGLACHQLESLWMLLNHIKPTNVPATSAAPNYTWVGFASSFSSSLNLAQRRLQKCLNVKHHKSLEGEPVMATSAWALQTYLFHCTVNTFCRQSCVHGALHQLHCHVGLQILGCVPLSADVWPSGTQMLIC